MAWSAEQGELRAQDRASPPRTEPHARPPGHAHAAARHGARNDLFIEWPEIFQRSSAAADEDHVVEVPPREVLEGSGNLPPRGGPLHPYRVNLQGDSFEPAPEDIEDVPDRFAGR